MADPEVRATMDRKANEFTIKTMTRFFLTMGASNHHPPPTLTVTLTLCHKSVAFSTEF